jgi:mannose-6-phosphate isomerase
MGHATTTDRPDVVVDHRPWGHFRQYAMQETCTVKLITVAAGQQLSLQRHRHRDELWVVLDDGLLITVGSRTVESRAGDEFFVPRGVIHRVEGGEHGGRFVEVCFGAFDENDIERLDDAYGRAGVPAASAPAGDLPDSDTGA